MAKTFCCEAKNHAKRPFCPETDIRKNKVLKKGKPGPKGIKDAGTLSNALPKGVCQILGGLFMQTRLKTD